MRSNLGLKNIVKADSAITRSVFEKLIEEDIVSWKGSSKK